MSEELNPTQEDVLRRHIFRLLDDKCLCAHTKEHNCIRCKLMWETKRAFPDVFAAAAEIYALSRTGRQ